MFLTTPLEIDFHSREGNNGSDSEVGEYFAKGRQKADVERALDQQSDREHQCLLESAIPFDYCNIRSTFL
jgi:hypothetical protein